MIAGPRVRGWDLALRTAIALPGAMPDAQGEGPVDLEIVHGSAELVDPGRTDGPYRLGRDMFAFAMPGVADYRCTRVRITVDRAPDADPGHVAAMLIATAVPAVLWMRGEVVLHAAAAVWPGATHAVAVLGRSGSGKSTWLAHAVAAGATIVADDTVCPRLGPGGVLASGLPGGYFAPLGGRDGERPFHPVPIGRQCARAPLGAIVVLDDRVPPGRLDGVAAVRALLTHRHRPRIARLLGIDGAALGTVAALARAVPVHAAPRDRAVAIAMALADP